MNKAEMRREMRIRASSLSEEQRRAGDESIAERLTTLPQYGFAERVFAYVGVGNEIAMRKIIERLLLCGKAVYVPLCRAGGEMDAVRIHALSELSPGSFGIPEPAAGGEVIPPGELDFIIVPGAAFGLDGTRLGRGGGYYDRFLQMARGALRVALCREINIEKTVPTEPHDEKVDIIVTERRVIKIQR